MRFEVILQSDDEGTTKPFPGCAWNEKEKRWETSITETSALVSLASRLGFSLRILATEEGRMHRDLPILEIRDKDDW